VPEQGNESGAPTGDKLVTIESRLPGIEKELGIPAGFLERLVREDDWSLVIKCHTLADLAVTHLIVTRLDEPALEPLLKSLTYADTRRGKLAFARALQLLSDEEAKMVDALRLLRNRLAHDIRCIGFSLREHAQQLSEEDFGRFAESFAMWGSLPVTSEMRANIRRVMKRAPGFTIWVAIVRLLSKAYNYSHRAQLERLFNPGFSNMVTLDTILARRSRQDG
jgi:hypothetical protein